METQAIPRWVLIYSQHKRSSTATTQHHPGATTASPSQDPPPPNQQVSLDSPARLHRDQHPFPMHKSAAKKLRRPQAAVPSTRPNRPSVRRPRHLRPVGRNITDTHTLATPPSHISTRSKTTRATKPTPLASQTLTSTQQHPAGSPTPEPALPNSTAPALTHISSVYDLSFPQFQAILTQTSLLRFKVDPLFASANRNMPANLRSTSTFQGQKPLKNSNVLLVHSLSTKKSKHGEVLKSNLAQVPEILGAKSVVIADQNVVDIEACQDEAQVEFCRRHGLDNIIAKVRASAAEVVTDAATPVAEKDGGEAKKKRKSKKSSVIAKNGLNEETFYNEAFLKLLTPELQTEFKEFQDQLFTAKLQATAPNTPLTKQLEPFDLVYNISTLQHPVSFPTILKRLHPQSVTTETIVDQPAAAKPATKTSKGSKPSSSSASVPTTTTTTSTAIKPIPPTITIQSEQTSLLSILSIFSLLPREALLHNPNSLKIAYIGFDYSNNTNFVPELIYLCRRLGVNLSLSTPSVSTQFTDMRAFEQSCLAAGKPIPITKGKRTKKSSAKKSSEDGLDSDNDPSVVDIDESLYDDLVFLEPSLFINDPAPGLSPHCTDLSQIKRYKAHLDGLKAQQQEQTHQSPSSSPDQQQQPGQGEKSGQSADGPESFEDAAALSASKINPASALQMIKQSTKTPPNPLSRSPMSKAKVAQPHSPAGTGVVTSAPGEKIPIRPALIEYSHHPFVAVQNADFIITNSIFPATTHSYMEHPSFELDKEMCSFSKDTMKLFHVTEGIGNWQLPPLGVHDPRCMLEQQAQTENYVLAALATVMMGKEVH